MDDKIGFGMTFERETNTPGTYAAAVRLKNVVAPTVTREAKDSTHHGSADGYREYIGGLKDGGEAELTVAFDPESTFHTAMAGDLESNAKHNYRVGLPAGTHFNTFAGFVTELGPATPLDDQLVCTFKVKVSGKPSGWLEPEED